MNPSDYVAVIAHAQCMGCGSRNCYIQATPVFVGPKPSRREQRRARKAAKNLAMYKLAGRRPWAQETGRAIFAHVLGHRFACKTFDVLYGPMRGMYGDAYRLRHLHEPSGFKRMSQFADYVADPYSGYVHVNLQGRGDK